MKFALDTMVVSEGRKARPHGAVRLWYLAHDPKAFVIPAVVIYELQMGIEKVRRHDPARADQFEEWLRDVVNDAQVLPFSTEIARNTARLLHGEPSDLFIDAAIAATARVHGLTVATRNTKHFERFNVSLVNPYETERRA